MPKRGSWPIVRQLKPCYTGGEVVRRGGLLAEPLDDELHRIGDSQVKHQPRGPPPVRPRGAYEGDPAWQAN